MGIEPTSSGLRDRCITLSATVPHQSARWELNPRPASYKDAALTVELRASESRAGGTRTHTCRIKSPVCCQLHHNPIHGWAYAFVASWQHRVLLSCLLLSVVALRIELSTTRLSAVSGQPALDYRAGRVPRSRTARGGAAKQSTPLLLPKQACFHLHLCPFVLSVRTVRFEPTISWPPTRRDNQASPRSVASTPWGSRTQALPGFVVPAPVHRTGHVVRVM